MPRLGEGGYGIRTLPALLGYRDIATTMIYTHVLDRGPFGACEKRQGGACQN